MQGALTAAAKELDTLRNNWLNPPEWTRTEVLEFLGSTDGPWRRYIDPETVRPLAGQNVPPADPAPGRAGLKQRAPPVAAWAS